MYAQFAFFGHYRAYESILMVSVNSFEYNLVFSQFSGVVVDFL